MHTALSDWVCVHVRERERKREQAFICRLASPYVRRRRRYSPLRNVSVPFCQSRSRSAETQKVTLSFARPLVTRAEHRSPACHCSSLTRSFVSSPPTPPLVLWLLISITPLSFPLFISCILVLLSSSLSSVPPSFSLPLGRSHLASASLLSCQAPDSRIISY